MARRPRSAAGTTSSLADSLIESTSGIRVPPREEDAREAAERTARSIEALAPPSAAEPPKREAPPLFSSANLGGGVAPDYQRIVETLHAADAFADYDDLERNLEVGEGRSDYSTLREHLDKAEQRARRAHRLFVGSKLELVRWELDSKKVVAAMRKEAAAALQARKDSGEITKRVTNDDVDAEMVDMFPDEVASQELTRVKMKSTTESLEHLVRRWDMKCGDLRTLLETLRK